VAAEQAGAGDVISMKLKAEDRGECYLLNGTDVDHQALTRDTWWFMPGTEPNALGARGGLSD
jgi:hypothetical protein